MVMDSFGKAPASANKYMIYTACDGPVGQCCGQPGMERQQLESFRRSLLSKQEEIEQLRSEGKGSADTVTLDQSKVGRLSRMDALQAQQMAKETERRRQIQLQKIAGALRRMDSGEYGLCVMCGDDIAPARLEIDPTSTRCLMCMEE